MRAASQLLKNAVCDSHKTKWYQLAMFPYPSGNLHIGHLRVYTISDTVARFHRILGKDVIHPMGWDAFGLPAENAAQQRGVNAKDWTYSNIDIMREQLKKMSPHIDWERELITCHPDYYKHTQSLFLDLHKHDLAYRAPAVVNWDPVDMTVLANEQVDSQGRSWRSGAVVEKKELEQWFLKITKYGETLNEDLALLKDWPQEVVQMQRNWIGRSTGAEIQFRLKDSSETLTVFTTRPETLPAVDFMALALDHPIVKALQRNNDALKAFCSEPHQPDSKAGFNLGVKAVNPLTQKQVEVFTAPYVLGDYGTGAVMGVPSLDERDKGFWEINGTFEPTVMESELVTHEQGTKIVGQLAEAGLAEPKTRLRLRDWLISRQRYWGAPIPMVHCDSCGVVPVKKEDLPVLLPENWAGGPLSNNTEWMKTDCPSCGKPAKRDPDTMDTFMDSSWYYLRFTDAQNKDVPFDKQKASSLMPVDLYIGGVEHAILHLLYSRFLSKFLSDSGKWNGSSFNGEPFKRLVTLGMVHGKTYTDPDTGAYLKPEEHTNGILNSNGKTASVSSEKMSKSKFNGVDPTEIIEKYGADATRAHILFQAPVNDVLEWDEQKISGVTRWLKKVDALVAKFHSHGQIQSQAPDEPSPSDIKAWQELVSLTSSIRGSIENVLALNTVVSDYMKFTRAASQLESPSLLQSAVRSLLIVLAPVCPNTADRCWSASFEGSVFEQEWPTLEPLVKSSAPKWTILINGRKKLSLVCEDGSQDAIISELRHRGLVVGSPKKVVYVAKKRLVNIIN